MKVTPINCGNCGSPVEVQQNAPLATCDHCQTSMTIEWPEHQQRRYISNGAGSPFVICPVCRSQQLRRDDQVGRQVPCPDCGSPSTIPPSAEYTFRICPECNRAYESYRGSCPDADDHPRRQYPGALF